MQALLAAAITAGPAPAVSALGPVAAERIELSPCWVKGVVQEVLCGKLPRPLDPNDPTGRHIDVHLAVLPAVARNKLPDPIFFFAGGPGQSAIDLAGAAQAMLSRFTNRRDIVLVDQRGTGRSAPLVCEKPDPWLPFAQAVDPARAIETRRACAAELRKLAHGDLRQYTTSIAVADIDAVRAGLGVSRVNLVGVSYGTRVALEYMRQHPQQVRSAVLDGVVPPDVSLPRSFSGDNQASLDAVFDACEDEPSCRSRYPQLRARWTGLLGSLPRSIAVTHPTRADVERFELSRGAVLGAVRKALYVPTLVASLPAVIDAAASGRFDALIALGSSGPSAGGMAEGMHFSVLCSEEPLVGKAGAYILGGDFGDDFERFYRAVCESWPKGEVGADFFEIPPAPAPTLLLSGMADPATPARHGERVAAKLGKLATHLVSRHATHGLMAHACMRESAYEFVDRAESATPVVLDAACGERVPRPRPYLWPQEATRPAK